MTKGQDAGVDGWIIRRENRRTLTGRECKKGRMEGTDERREEEKRTKARGHPNEGERKKGRRRDDIRTKANRQKKRGGEAGKKMHLRVFAKMSAHSRGCECALSGL